MCSATDGASPVNRCTVAASAIFSCTVRGVPGVPNTLNRVPELPYAHEGTSMARCSRSVAMSAKLLMSVTRLVVLGGCGVGELVLEVEDLAQPGEPGVGAEGLIGAEALEELRHLGLPPRVDLGG